MKNKSVVLNMSISPEIFINQSNMIILDKMIADFNKILKLINMKFGNNGRLKYLKPFHLDVPTPHPVKRPILPITQIGKSKENIISVGQKK